MRKKESILWEEYIEKSAGIYLSQLDLAVLLPVVEQEIAKLEDEIEDSNGSFSKEYKQDTLTSLVGIYNLLDEEYYAEPTATRDWEEEYEPDEVDDRD